MNSTSIETYTGEYFDYTAAGVQPVAVNDVARALSNICRFGGHVSRFYSVAEHAVLVSRLVGASFDAELAYAALHHDSHEAYLGDIPSPLKRMLGINYELLADWVDHEVMTVFSIRDEFQHDAIKAADAEALQIEAAVLKPSRGVWTHRGITAVAAVPEWAVQCWTPLYAESRFLDRHYSLRRELGL